MGPGPSSTRAAQALRDLYPRHALLVPAAIVLSAVLLLIGLSRPLIFTEQLIFWESTYSVWTGVVSLWKQGEQVLAAILFFFSIVFPIVKLLGLVIIWWTRLPDDQRAKLLHWLGILGKWSMLDVFIVAILIVLVKIGPLARVEPRSGVYAFTAAILCSMVSTMYVERLARRAARPTGPTKSAGR